MKRYSYHHQPVVRASSCQSKKDTAQSRHDRPSPVRAGVAVIVLLAIVSAAVAHASPLYSTSAYVQASSDANSYSSSGALVTNTYEDNYQTFTTGGIETADSPLSQNAIIYPDKIPVTWSTDGSSQANGSVRAGSMHAYAYAQATLTPLSFTDEGYDSSGTFYDTTTQTPLEAYSHASVADALNDTFTFSSSTLAPSDNVSFAVTLGLDGSATSGPTGYSNAYIETYYRFGVSYTDSGGYSDTYSTAFNGLGAAGTRTDNFTVPLDATLTLYWTMDVNADAASTGLYGGLAAVGLATATADASNTASLYLVPTSSDFTIASASGHDYSTPVSTSVPEPVTAILVLLGLGALGLVRCQRGRPFASPG